MAVSIGNRTPEFELEDAHGERHAHGHDGGQVTVIYWTCNHCPYALAWQDRLHGVAADYAERGVRFLAVNSNDAERYPADSREAMRERIEAEEWSHPYLHDETQEVARGWGAERTPEVFVVDSDGVLRYHGAPDSDYEDPGQNAAWLREALDAVLAGEEVQRPENDAVGCTIKWKP